MKTTRLQKISRSCCLLFCCGLRIFPCPRQEEAAMKTYDMGGDERSGAGHVCGCGCPEAVRDVFLKEKP